MFSRASGTGSESCAMRTFSHSTRRASRVRGTGRRWPASSRGDAVSSPPARTNAMCSVTSGAPSASARSASSARRRGSGPVGAAEAERDPVRHDGDAALAQPYQRVGKVTGADVLRDRLDPVDAGQALHRLGDLGPPADADAQVLHGQVMAQGRGGEPWAGTFRARFEVGAGPAQGEVASASKSTRPVASSIVMWSSTVLLASVARSRMSELRVLARTRATRANTLPCEARIRLANLTS